MTPNEGKKLVESFVSGASDAQKLRARNFYRYENFVDGDQWMKEENPPQGAPKLTFNQTSDFLTVYLSKLIPRNPLTGNMEMGVRVKSSVGSDKEKQEREILDTYDREYFPSVLLEQSQNFFVGGAACLYYPLDVKKQRSRILSLDPRTCYVAFDGDRLSQFAFSDSVTLSDVPSSNTGMVGAIREFFASLRKNVDAFAEVPRMTYWDSERQIVVVGNNVAVIPHNYGFVPASWIPNNPKSHRHEGRSDVRALMHIDREYNFRASDVGNRVKHNTRPNLAIFSELDVDKVERDDKGILPLGKDDDAKFLTVPEEITALRYLEMLERRMRFKMGINDAVLGEMRSNVSAAAMTYYFSPLLDRIALKRVYWDRAFRELNNAILTYKFGRKEYRTEPVYHSPLTIDTASHTDNVVKLLQNKLISYVDAIDQLRGSENALTKFGEIRKEAEELANVPGFSNNPTP